MSEERWPPLPLEEWHDTRDTLHMWTQIVGKIALALTPPVNHFWNVTFRVTPRGLTTVAIPHAARTFTASFDFIDHQLILASSEGTTRNVPLAPRTVTDMYREIMRTAREMGIDVTIWSRPVEVPDPIRFEEDVVHASYDREYANRFWRILVQTGQVLEDFRSRFVGKCSPVHFFWGSLDLAVTRFSGRPAPPRPGADSITREAYSHEVISHGFWPGSGGVAMPAFYAYAAPEPEGLKGAQVKPAEAFYNRDFSNFILPYDVVRTARAPARVLTAFLESTYDIAADLAVWDRSALERPRPALQQSTI
jgi:hypothetical protein